VRRVMIYGGTGGAGLAAGRVLRARGYALPLTARDPGRQSNAAERGETPFRAKV
jgi:short-subunit dehydrogenase